MEENNNKLGNYIIDIAAGPFGSNLKVSCFIPSGFPIIDGANLKSFKVTDNITKFVTEEKARSLHRAIAKRNDVIVTISGNVGQISYIPEDSKYEEYLVSQRQFRVTFDENRVHVPYLVYYFHTFEGQHKILSFANQVGVPALTQPLKNFRNIDINFPEIKKQVEIANILKSLDDKIEINRRINDNLEQQAQALFKSWFVDFEPFKDGEFEESEIGMIPKGWKVTTFINNIDIMPGGTPSTNIDEYWKNGDIPFFSPKDVRGVYCFETEKYITKLGLNHCNSHLYPKDTLFITARGTVGKITLAGVPMAMNQSNYALVAKEGIGKYYLYLLAHSLVNVLLKKANGAVFSAITTKDFIEPTITPPMSVLQNFERIISSLFEKIHAIGIESHNLSSLRDALLPRLMSGELKPSNITL